MTLETSNGNLLEFILRGITGPEYPVALYSTRRAGNLESGKKFNHKISPANRWPFGGKQAVARRFSETRGFVWRMLQNAERLLKGELLSQRALRRGESDVRSYSCKSATCFDSICTSPSAVTRDSPNRLAKLVEIVQSLSVYFARTTGKGKTQWPSHYVYKRSGNGRPGELNLEILVFLSEQRMLW